MISLQPFHIWFITQHPTKKKEDVRRELGLSKGTASRIWKDEKLSLDVIDKICEVYGLPIEKVIMWKPGPWPDPKKPGDEEAEEAPE